MYVSVRIRDTQPNLHFFNLWRLTIFILTQHHQEITGTAEYWLSTNHCCPILIQYTASSSHNAQLNQLGLVFTFSFITPSSILFKSLWPQLCCPVPILLTKIITQPPFEMTNNLKKWWEEVPQLQPVQLLLHKSKPSQDAGKNSFGWKAFQMQRM